MRKRIYIYSVFAFLLAFGLVRLYYRATDDFRASNYTYHGLPYNQEYEIPPLTQDESKFLVQVLSQEYRYLGKGAQSYAFLSEDGNYVIKLIKFKHIKPSLIVRSLPSVAFFDKMKEKHFERKNKILNGVFTGYYLAYKYHRNDSGIVYVHLNKTQDLNQTITLYDKLGIRRKVDLDNVIFVVQHRATKTRDVMRNALSKGDIDLAKKRMNQVFDLYFREFDKGIYDRDPGVLHNTGFIDDRVIHLDVGKLVRNDPENYPNAPREKFYQVLSKFDVWIKANYPEAYPELVKEIQVARTQVDRKRVI